MTKADAVSLPETALVTLFCRANEARRPDGIIDDPMAVGLLDSIDYDFSKFKLRGDHQDLALRALAFDNSARGYLAKHPHATVVALGEGLQTSFWRLDAAGVGDGFRWLTVDLPPNIALRERLLPQSPRVSLRAQSVLDFSWMDQINPEEGVFITAEGLLPYLLPDEALRVIGECARRFPGGQMMFDLPPKSQAVLARNPMWTALRGNWPRTPFSLTVPELADLSNTVPGVRAVHNLPIPRGRGPVFDRLLSQTQGRPVGRLVRRWVGITWPTLATLTLLEFAA
ncbi:O-methyltransferase domain-containing protein [uncultured Mycobacterium sp.]|uniref:O-methyltransferase domain-containing protein n=1 Tax=uncultured Mycobacterium sp. TaxID=171292 RepID=A0A1Y5PAI2_9MYCO|nr:O-methyltransferase domain-containing protein [uncultured Mycobacterium sp.]SBS75705.1 O-methyltransferase domain-containing protein [uncultured Mycobacterium sp.]